MMPAPRNSTRPRPRPTYRAKFSGLYLNVLGERRVSAWSPDIELRPLSERSDLYGIFLVVNGQRLVSHGYQLRDAKNVIAAQFEKQLTEWEEVKPCSAP